MWPSSSQELRPDSTGTTRKRERNEKRIVEYVDSFTPFQKWRWYVESYWWNLFSQMEIQSWNVNFKTEVCTRTADPQITMLWIKEVEIAKSIDELVTSRSIVGRTHFPDFDMLHAMIASALKELLNTQIHFRKKDVSVEEQRAQKHDRFLRGRHIAYMIYEYFRANGAHTVPMKQCKDSQTCSLLSFLQNDDVQDFDVRWDHALLSVSEMSSGMILEGLHKSKLQYSAQLRTVMALCDQGVARNNGTPNYEQLKTAVKLHTDQMMRNRNFRTRNDVVERGSVTKSEEGKKAFVERKVGECFQWKAHGQCSQGDSCGFSHDTMAFGNSGAGQRRKGRSSSPASNSKAEGQKPSQGSGNKEESSSDKRSEIPCRFNKCKNPSCKFWDPPVCQNHKSERGCIYGDKFHFRHVEAEGKPSKRSKKGGAKGSGSILKESIQLVCVSQDSHPRKSFLREPRRLGSKRAVKFLKMHLTPH